MRRNHPKVIVQNHKEAFAFLHDVITLAWQNTNLHHLASPMARDSNRVVMTLVRRDINEQLVAGTFKKRKAEEVGLKVVSSPTDKEKFWFTIEGVPGEIHLVSKPRGRNALPKANLEIIGQSVIEIPGLEEAQSGNLYLQVEGGTDSFQPKSISLVLLTNYHGGWDVHGEEEIASAELDAELLATTVIDTVAEEAAAAEDEDFFDQFLERQEDLEENKAIDIETYEGTSEDHAEESGGESASTS